MRQCCDLHSFPIIWSFEKGKKEGLNDVQIWNTTYGGSDQKGVDIAEYMNKLSSFLGLLAWDNDLGVVINWEAHPKDGSQRSGSVNWGRSQGQNNGSRQVLSVDCRNAIPWDLGECGRPPRMSVWRMCGKTFIYWPSPLGCGLLPGALTSAAMLDCDGTAWGRKTLSGHLRLDARKVERTWVGAELSVCAAVSEITGGPRGGTQGTRGICYTSLYFTLNHKINHIFLLNDLFPGRKCFVF